MGRPPAKHLDRILADWAFEPGQPQARRVVGADGRELLQLRVDMGVLQLETVGRPDSERPHGFPTYYDYLVSAAFEEGDRFVLNDDRCLQIDREFYQFYHRRICWLALREYGRAAQDAEHTLRLMDFSSANAPVEEWAWMHEQYRPFVMFHRIQATALAELESSNPEAAVQAIDLGLEQLAAVLDEKEFDEDGDEGDDDAFVEKLREMRGSIAEHYELKPSLADQLAQAIAAEQYERAAEIRDRMSRASRKS
ncbi:MAG: UvrB/UvrC motif-containing protein [Planctomycetales bacterium]|nr:UvrB/UvrC motif-containing protein [Planctomycetales bacterium]